MQGKKKGWKKRYEFVLRYYLPIKGISIMMSIIHEEYISRELNKLLQFKMSFCDLFKSRERSWFHRYPFILVLRRLWTRQFRKRFCFVTHSEKNGCWNQTCKPWLGINSSNSQRFEDHIPIFLLIRSSVCDSVWYTCAHSNCLQEKKN